MSVYEKMTALADAVRSKANRSDTLTIDAMTAAVNGLVVGTPSTQTLTVIPTKEKQTFSSSDLGSNTYYSVVTVNAIPAEYITTADATASTYDILEGETAYVKGVKVTGRIKNYGDVTETFSNASDLLSIEANGYFNSITVNLTRKTLEVTPTKSAQTLRASSEGSDVFYTQVNVAPIPAEYITTADATAAAGTILEGETAYVNGEKVTGVYIPVGEQDVRWGMKFGHSDLMDFQYGSFTGDATAEAEDIAPGKTAYAVGMKVTGAMPAKQAETYTPGTADITINSGVYLSGDQVIKGDSDLTASNIKSGVSIFNVSGTFTSDATATASDIAKGKTAYVNGVKVTGTSEGGEAFYKCTAVFGPSTVTFLTVTGAGADCNGRYDDSGMKKNGNSVYQFTNTSGQKWYICCCKDEYEGNYWLLCDNMDVSYPYGAHYFSQDINSGWQNGEYGEGSSPTVTKETEIINANQPKSWNGRKAVLSEGVYSFSEEETTGLEYGGGYTPSINNIYNGKALIEVRNIWTGLPTEGLFFYAPLSSRQNAANTGQSLLTNGSVEFNAIGGVPCCNLDTSGYIEASLNWDVGYGDFTVSTWVYVNTNSSNSLIYSSGMFRLAALTNGKWETTILSDTEGRATADGFAPGKWYHTIFMRKGQTAWLYINGALAVQFDGGYSMNWEKMDLGFWKNGPSDLLPMGGSLSAFRIYNRVLSDSEISALADEFKPAE